MICYFQTWNQREVGNNIGKDDIVIRDNVLSFKNPIVINVDSQVEGEIVILKSSSGIVDRAVDVFTSGRKAQEFFAEKSQRLVYETSNYVMSSDDINDKIVKYTKDEIESLINLATDKKIRVDIDRDDIILVNIDMKD